MEFEWGPLLKLDETRRSIGGLKPKQAWDKLYNEGSKANAWALYNILIGLVLTNFIR